MEYTVEMTVGTARPLTEDMLSGVAVIGGAAAGHVGGKRLETTLTVEADDPPAAVRYAIDRVVEIVPGHVIAVEAMTTAEQDRRLEEARPEFVGVTEVAAMLGVTKQRVSQLAARQDFPEPVARLASGPVWRRGDLSTFADGWQRKPGRPFKVKTVRRRDMPRPVDGVFVGRDVFVVTKSDAVRVARKKKVRKG